MAMERILMIEDDAGIREIASLYLTKKGYEFFTAENPVKALDLVKDKQPHLILLDIVLPRMDGFQLCEKIRQMTDVPIIFLSAKREAVDKVKGFEAGGDDYLTKPFDLAELNARIKAHIRRSKMFSERFKKNSVITHSDLSIDIDSCEVHQRGVRISLFAKELQLLLLFVEHPNQVFSSEQIYDHIWGRDRFGDLKTVMVHISMLRKKIEKNPAKPEYIKTVRGFGYKLNPHPEN